MSELNTVSYNQFEDIPSLGEKSKVIFSEKSYNFLLSLINETKENQSERGCYLVGRASSSSDSPLCFYFDFCSSPFQTVSGNFVGGAVLPSANNKMELLNELERYKALGIEACIMHFHTHNLNGFFSSMSDQDYGVYATMKHVYGCEIFGMLAAPNKAAHNDTFELSVVITQKPVVIGERGCASFYLIPNIFYCKGNQIYKTGSFARQTPASKTATTEIDRRDRFVQNYREWSGASLISGVGNNPNTGLPIIDENVGYIDVNNTLNFQNENLTLVFPSLNQNDVDRRLI